jgi:dipeptidase
LSQSSFSLFDELQASGWWDSKKEKLDWLKAVSYGEINHPYYSLRRIWRITQRLQPSKQYSPWVKDGFTKDYPITFKPDQKLTLSDLMGLHRDHYEGTSFDMTKGLAAGPFGSPYRYTGPYDGSSENLSQEKKLTGAWERPISVFNVGYIYINQARSWLPDPIGGISWIGPDKPYLTCFVPFYVGITDLPQAYQTCNILKFDRGSAWWTFNFISNLAALKFSYMKEDILAEQRRIEELEQQNIPSIDSEAMHLFKIDPEASASFLTEFCQKNADEVLNDWWALSELLLVKYSDGYVNIPELSKSVGYPEEWLKKTEYRQGPTSYKKKKS